MKMRNALPFILTSLLPLYAFSADSDRSAQKTQGEKSPAIEATYRDPFWPVGYFPKQRDIPEQGMASSTNKTTTTDTSNGSNEPQTVRWPDLKLKGLIKQRDGSYIAVLDSVGVVEAGQIVSLRQGNMVFRYKMESIDSKGVSQRKLDYKPWKPQGGQKN